MSASEPVPSRETAPPHSGDSSDAGVAPPHTLRRRHSRQPTPKAEVDRRFAEVHAKMAPSERGKFEFVPLRYRLTYKRAIIGDLTAKRAVKAFCQGCQGYEQLPESVRDCTVQSCPLHAMRPYQATARTPSEQPVGS